MILATAWKACVPPRGRARSVMPSGLSRRAKICARRLLNTVGSGVGECLGGSARGGAAGLCEAGACSAQGVGTGVVFRSGSPRATWAPEAGRAMRQTLGKPCVGVGGPRPEGRRKRTLRLCCPAEAAGRAGRLSGGSSEQVCRWAGRHLCLGGRVVARRMWQRASVGRRVVDRWTGWRFGVIPPDMALGGTLQAMCS